MDKKKKPAPFNNPFQKLKLPEKEKPAKAAKPPPPPPKKKSPADDDVSLFYEALDGVVPISNRPAAVLDPNVPLPPRVNEEAESLAQLAELVDGSGPFDIADTDEFIEGAAGGLDPRVVRSLRKGQFAVQGHLDLHGLTQAEARPAVEQFLTIARRDGKRCVLIVHGRGLNSKDQIPVLKERLRVWLTQGRIGRMVLAFATARPYDGGAGAVYVLLRR